MQGQPQRSGLSPTTSAISHGGFLNDGVPHHSWLFSPGPRSAQAEEKPGSTGKYPSICLTLASLPLRPQTDVIQMGTEGGQGAREAWK